MAALIERSDQIVSFTDLARRGKGLFDKVASSEKDRLVVLRKSEPIAVVLNVNAFENLLDEVEELRTENVALNRIAGGNQDYLGKNEIQHCLEL